MSNRPWIGARIGKGVWAGSRFNPMIVLLAASLLMLIGYLSDAVHWIRATF